MSEPPKIYKQRHIGKIIAAVFGILLAFAAIFSCLCLFGFRHYSRYTDTGKLYLSIPWLSDFMQAPSTEDSLAAELTATAGSWKNGKPVNTPFSQTEAPAAESVPTGEKESAASLNPEDQNKDNHPSDATEYSQASPPGNQHAQPDADSDEDADTSRIENDVIDYDNDFEYIGEEDDSYYDDSYYEDDYSEDSYYEDDYSEADYEE